MAKYINADTVIQALRETIDRYKDSEVFTRTVRAAENMILIIDRIPPADVVEKSKLKEDLIDYLGGLYPADEFMEMLEAETE